MDCRAIISLETNLLHSECSPLKKLDNNLQKKRVKKSVLGHFITFFTYTVNPLCFTIVGEKISGKTDEALKVLMEKFNYNFTNTGSNNVVLPTFFLRFFFS